MATKGLREFSWAGLVGLAEDEFKEEDDDDEEFEWLFVIGLDLAAAFEKLNRLLMLNGWLDEGFS